MCIWRVAGGVGQADLAHRERLTGAGPVGDVQLDLGVGQCPGVGAAVLVGVGVLAELVLLEVGDGAFAPGQGVEPGRVQVGEQRRRPAAAVEPDQHPTVVADQGAQLGDQPAQLTGQRGARFGHHHQQRIPGGVGDPGFHRGRGRELQPRHMGFRDPAGARIGAYMPVDIEHRRLLGAVGHVPGRHRGDPVAGPTRLGELPDLAADGIVSRWPCVVAVRIDRGGDCGEVQGLPVSDRGHRARGVGVSPFRVEPARR